MAALATAAALGLSFAVAGDAFQCAPRSVSFFPEMEISEAETEFEWPFSVDRGTLTCVRMRGERIVLFFEPWRDDVPQEFGNMTPPRSVMVSANPIALLAALEDRDLYLPFDSLETLILRLAPFETMGRRLCDEDADRQERTL